MWGNTWNSPWLCSEVKSVYSNGLLIGLIECVSGTSRSHSCRHSFNPLQTLLTFSSFISAVILLPPPPPLLSPPLKPWSAHLNLSLSPFLSTTYTPHRYLLGHTTDCWGEPVPTTNSLYSETWCFLFSLSLFFWKYSSESTGSFEANFWREGNFFRAVQ